MQESLRLLFVCDSDSNIAFSSQFAAYAGRHGAECHIAFCASKQEVLMQAAHAKGDFNTPTSIQTSWRRLFESVTILDYDVIFVMISGKDVPFFCDALRRMAMSYGRPKPKTIGGFIGEWISGEGQVSERTGLDVFIVNREDEVSLFRTMSSRLGFGCRFVHIPYGFVVRYDWAKPLPRTFRYSPDIPLLFAEQVQVPRSPEERRLLFRNLVALAQANPDREIWFCEREVPGGATLHRSIGSIDEHFDDLAMLAPNLIRKPGQFRKALPQAQCVISVSSTACIEALVNGIPALFIEGFNSSGADKFAFTGLRVALSDLYREQELSIQEPFYSSVGDPEAWPKLLDLVSEYKRTSVGEAPCVGTVLTNTSVTMTARSALFEAVGRMLRPATTPLSDAVITFQDVDQLRPAIEGGAAMVSDTILVEGRAPRPEAVAVGEDGGFEAGIGAGNMCLHLNVPLIGLKKVVISVEIDGVGRKLEITNAKVTAGVGADVGNVDLLEIDRSGVRTAVLRLTNFRSLRVLGGNVRPDRGFKRPPAVFIELSAYPSNPDVISRRTRVSRIPCNGEDACVIFSPADWRTLAPAARIFSLTSDAGGSIAIERGAERELTVTIEGGENPVRRTFPSLGTDLIIVFATREVALVMVNQNLIVASRTFSPNVINLSGGLAEVESCFDSFDVFRGSFSAVEIDRVIELVTLRLFAGEAFADRHIAIPDFRADLEKAMGIAPGETVPSMPPAAPAARNEAAVPKTSPTEADSSKAAPKKPKNDNKSAAPAEKGKAPPKPPAPQLVADVGKDKPKGDKSAEPAKGKKPDAAKVESADAGKGKSKKAPAQADAEPVLASTPPTPVLPVTTPMAMSLPATSVAPMVSTPLVKSPEPLRASDNVHHLGMQRGPRNIDEVPAPMSLTPTSRAVNVGMGAEAPPESQLRPIELSRMALDRGDYEEVLQISTRAIQHTPTSSLHMLYVALAFEKLGRHEEAVSYAKQALSHRPTLSRAQKLIGRLGGKVAHKR